MRGDGEAFRLGLGQRRVGRDEGDRGGRGRRTLPVKAPHSRRHRRRQADAAELFVLLEGAGPEMWAAADHRGRDGVDDDERADRDAVGRKRARRAEAALEIRRCRAEAAAGAAEGEVGARRRRGGVAELAIGRIAAPALVAAVEQVEHDRLGDERHPRRADGKSDALFAQERLHAAGRIEAEGGAAGEDDRVHAQHRLVGFKEVRFPGSRSAAEDRVGHRDVAREQRRGRPRSQAARPQRCRR